MVPCSGKFVHFRHKLLKRLVHKRLKQVERLRAEAVGKYSTLDGMLSLGTGREK